MYASLSCLIGALSLAAAASLNSDWPSQYWDAIIVGAGTAGIVVADRLSEAGHKTLLLEQGGKSYGILGGRERPDWLNGTELSRVDVPGLCEWSTERQVTANGPTHMSDRYDHFRRQISFALPSGSSRDIPGLHGRGQQCNQCRPLLPTASLGLGPLPS